MRGYLSFLLVFAALAILIVLANSYNSSKSVNFSKAIALERAEQISLDAKRGMLTAAKYGAIAGFLEYTAEIGASGGFKAFDPAEAKERVKQGMYSSLLLLDFSSESDYQVALWCGEVPSERAIDELAEQSIKVQSPLICQNCKPLSSPECEDFLDVEVLMDGQSKKVGIADIALGSENLGGSPRLFGATVYSPKFGVSKVSYIPTSEKIFEQPYFAPDGLVG